MSARYYDPDEYQHLHRELDEIVDYVKDLILRRNAGMEVPPEMELLGRAVADIGVLAATLRDVVERLHGEGRVSH